MSESNLVMKFRWSRHLAALTAAAAVAACSMPEQVVHAEKTAPPKQGVVATVGEVEISQQEVEALVASELKKLEQQRYELLQQGIERLVADKLIEQEAARRQLSTEELLAEEVTSKVKAPTDADVDAFYQERQAQIRQPKEQVADRIREFLGQQSHQQAFDDLIARLKTSFPVSVYLDPIRTEVAAGDSPAKGPADAPVTIVEFSDFECPFCSRVVPTLDQVTANYGDKVRLVFRQFPLRSIHPNAQKAAEAALCAHDQGKFWALHDKMFADQSGLGVAQLKVKAAAVGLEAEAFNQCLDSGKYADQVEQDLEDGTQAGVTGTPALFVNGRFLSGAQPYEAIAALIDDELERAGRSVEQ